jgi:hypothetical protein
VLLTIRSAINTKTAQAGDGVYLQSSFPVIANGRAVIPAGVYVQGWWIRWSGTFASRGRQS